MIKVFTLNKNGKIELTKKELEQLLNESYWEGYNKKNYQTYTSPIVFRSYDNNITCGPSEPYIIKTTNYMNYTNYFTSSMRLEQTYQRQPLIFNEAVMSEKRCMQRRTWSWYSGLGEPNLKSMTIHSRPSVITRSGRC